MKRKNNIRKVAKVGAFECEYYENPTKISTSAITFRTPDKELPFLLKVSGHTAGYLRQSIKQGNDKELQGFAMLMYTVANSAYVDDEFAKDITNAVGNLLKRLNDEAKSKAEAITKEEDDLNAQIINSAIERGHMSAEEIEQSKAELAEGLDELIKESDNG